MIPRMRTPAEAIREIKREDPESGIMEHFIRKLVRDGKIASVMAGRKLLVNLDSALAYLFQPTTPSRVATMDGHDKSLQEGYGEIRRII